MAQPLGERGLGLCLRTLVDQGVLPNTSDDLYFIPIAPVQRCDRSIILGRLTTSELCCCD